MRFGGLMRRRVGAVALVVAARTVDGGWGGGCGGCDGVCRCGECGDRGRSPWLAVIEARPLWWVGGATVVTAGAGWLTRWAHGRADRRLTAGASGTSAGAVGGRPAGRSGSGGAGVVPAGRDDGRDHDGSARGGWVWQDDGGEAGVGRPAGAAPVRRPGVLGDTGSRCAIAGGDHGERQQSDRTAGSWSGGHLHGSTAGG